MSNRLCLNMTAGWLNPALLRICLSIAAVAPAACAATPNEPPLRLEQVINGALRHRYVIVAAQKRLEAARGIRTAAVAPDSDAARYNAAQVRLISRVKQAYHRLRQAYLMRDLIENWRNDLGNLLTAAQADASAAKTGQQDIQKAQVQISLLDMRLIEVANDLHAREMEINLLLGRPADSSLARPPEAKTPVIGVSLDELQRRAAESTAPSHGGDLTPGNLEPTVACNYMSNGELNEDALDLYDEETRSVPYRIGDEYARAQNAAKTISVLSTTILPQARSSAQSSRMAYEKGTAGFLDVLTSDVTVFDAEMTYHHAVERFFVAAVRLEELTGMDPAQ